MAIEIAKARDDVLPQPTRSLTLGRRRIGTKERMFLLEQLCLLLETGLTLHAALSSIRKEASSKELASVLDALIDDIATGRSFSAALERHSKVFSRTYSCLVAAGEQGGFLADVLGQLLQMEERRAKLQSAMLAAGAYPVFLTLFSAGAVIFILVVVFPQFGELFAGIADELPITTKALMWCSEFLRANWLYCIAAVAVAAAGLHQWSTNAAARAALDRLKLRAPIWGDVCLKLYLVQSLRTMGLSLKNGVSAVDALAACQDVVDNVVFRDFLADVRRGVESGGSLSAGFARAEFIPATVRQLVATGDESGNLAKVMARLADHYERELEKQLAMLSRFAEPVMLLIMGAVVGLIVSSLILPIFMLSRSIG